MKLGTVSLNQNRDRILSFQVKYFKSSGLLTWTVIVLHRDQSRRVTLEEFLIIDIN